MVAFEFNVMNTTASMFEKGLYFTQERISIDSLDGETKENQTVLKGRHLSYKRLPLTPTTSLYTLISSMSQSEIMK